MKTLETGIKNSRNVVRYMFGHGSLADLESLLLPLREGGQGVVFIADCFFEKEGLPAHFPAGNTSDTIIFIDTAKEPTTAFINQTRDALLASGYSTPDAIVGMGGGITMDVAKAVSNLLTNGGQAEKYQGWDLVKSPGIYKIGIPTLSGTGAEATRTCVMTNPANGLKLGMNSDHTVFDQVILDPSLTASVPRNQYFYTGMDAYIHCIESLHGQFRNAVGDAFSNQALQLTRDVFLSDDMMSEINREKLMVASYLGGCAIANSYVGVIHPFSAGLSVVFGIHHCIANCMVMMVMEEFYPDVFSEFSAMVEKQEIEIPSGICKELSDEQHNALYNATIIHEKPLTNALGEKFRDILTTDKVREIFRRI